MIDFQSQLRVNNGPAGTETSLPVSPFRIAGFDRRAQFTEAVGLKGVGLAVVLRFRQVELARGVGNG
jgi:hypothetical protein